jgi:hypothetical protein
MPLQMQARPRFDRDDHHGNSRVGRLQLLK